MTGRWREENWFRYGRAHFALDSLDSYAVTPDDPARMVPNPAKKTAAAAVKAATEDPRRRRGRPPAQAGRAAQPRARQPDPDHQRDARQAGRPRRCRPPQASKPPRPQAKATPAKIPLREHNPDMVRLEAETKLITHAIKMAAFNAETSLARALNGSYARAGDEAYALIREALHASGDIIPGDGTLTIRLGPLSAPRRTRALAALCAQLNTTATCYPGTKLVLRYEVGTPPALHKRSPMSGVLSSEASSDHGRGFLANGLANRGCVRPGSGGLDGLGEDVRGGGLGGADHVRPVTELLPLSE